MRTITFRTQLLMNLGTFCAVVLLLLANQTFAGSARLAAVATAPSTISYQGHLSDSAGAPINATLPMTFKLYDASQTLLWTEARTGANAVPVTNGLFNVALGAVTPIDPASVGQELWLGISVDGDAEMTPRGKIGGVPVAYTVADGSITKAKLASDVHVALIQSGSVSDGNQTPTWTLHQGSGDRSYTVHVTFTTPFNNIPTIVLGLTAFDTNVGAGQRVHVYAASPTREGFDLVFHTWSDSIWYSGIASWVAYSAE